MDEIQRAKHRPIRSFVRREGRLTPGQDRALQELLPKFGIDLQNQYLNFLDTYGNDNPVIMEIGIGNGRLLAEQSVKHTEYNFLGLEVHRPGVGQLLMKVAENHSENVRVINDDAMQVLKNMIRPGSLYALWLFFPDPWPKKKHHKRRIVNENFLQIVRTGLRKDGILHIATDWQDYADDIQDKLNISGLFKPADSERLDTYPFKRPQTHFEQRGIRKGHKITDFWLTPVDG